MCNQRFDWEKLQDGNLADSEDLGKDICKMCGAWLHIDPFKNELFCPSCGHIYKKIKDVGDLGEKRK